MNFDEFLKFETYYFSLLLTWNERHYDNLLFICVQWWPYSKPMYSTILFQTLLTVYKQNTN